MCGHVFVLKTDFASTGVWRPLGPNERDSSHAENRFANIHQHNRDKKKKDSSIKIHLWRLALQQVVFRANFLILYRTNNFAEAFVSINILPLWQFHGCVP